MDVKSFALFAGRKKTEAAVSGLQSQVLALVNGAGIFEGYVDTYADLPLASEHASRIWVVKTATGIPLINKKESGMYLSDGTNWTFLDSSNAELAKYTVGSESLVTENLVIEGSGVAVTLDKTASKIIFALPNTNAPNGALILDSSGNVPENLLTGYLMKPQGNIASPGERLTLGGGNLPIGTLLKVVNAVEGENGTSYLLMSAPSNNPDNWIVFTGTNFPVTQVFGRTGEVIATLGDYTDSLVTLAADVDIHIAGTSIDTVLTDLFQKLGNKAAVDLSNVSSTDLINAIKGAGFGITDVAGLAIALSEKEPALAASTISQYYRGDKTWQSFGAASLATPLDGLTTANSPIDNGISLIAALGRLQGQISSISTPSSTSTPNKFNIDLSSGASADNCYFDDSYYHLFGSGTLTAAGAAQFPRLPLVASFAEAKAHAAMVAGFFHRWLIAFGGENDSTFDQLAGYQAATSGLFSGTTFLGGLSTDSTDSTDVDAAALNATASEFFIIPVARDASYIYYITAAYSMLTAYNANYGNKIVCFYNGQEGSGYPVAPAVSSGHSNQFSVRYAPSLMAKEGQSIWMQLTVKKRNG